MSESAKLPGQAEPGLAPAEEAFLRYVRQGGGDPIADANKVYLHNLRACFYAGWMAGHIDSSLSKNETIDTQLSKEQDD